MSSRRSEFTPKRDERGMFVGTLRPTPNYRLYSVKAMRRIVLSIGAVVTSLAYLYFDARIPYANLSIVDQWNAVFEGVAVGAAFTGVLAFVVVSSPNFKNRRHG